MTTTDAGRDRTCIDCDRAFQELECVDDVLEWFACADEASCRALNADYNCPRRER